MNNLSDMFGLNICLSFGGRVGDHGVIHSISWLEFYHHLVWTTSREGMMTMLSPFKEFWLYASDHEKPNKEGKIRKDDK